MHGVRHISYGSPIIRVVIGIHGISRDGHLCRTEQVVTIVRLFAVVEASAQTQFHVQSLSHFHAQVGTDVVTLVIPVARTDDTALVHISDRNVIFHFLRTACQAQVVWSLGSGATHRLTPPVRTCRTVPVGFQLFLWISGSSAPRVGIVNRFIVKRSVLISIHHLRIAGHFLKTYIAVIFYLYLLFRPFLGSNQQNTVWTFKTVNSCGGIFQDRDGFDIIRVELRIITLDTVYNHQHASISANIDGSSIITGASATLYGTQTRQTSGEHIRHTGSFYFHQLIRRDGSYRTGHGSLFLNTVTYHHYLVQRLGIFLQSYFQSSLPVHPHFCCFISYIGNL